jgi:peroxiredoxin Q/BCP
VVFGVSLDSQPSHRRFREKEKLPFDILVDDELRLCRMYDVRVTNLLVVRLAARVTYLIGKNGLILRAYEKVTPKGHAAEVLCSLPP